MSLLAISIVLVPLRAKKVESGHTTLAVCAMVPVMAIGIYAIVGSPNLVADERAHASDGLRATDSVTRPPAAGQLGSVGSLTKGLEDRLEREPDDAGGWLLLAQSYNHLGQSTDAIEAYKKAKALGKTDANLERTLLGSAEPVEQITVQSGPALRGSVALGPDALALIEPTDTVFIFAKESLDHRMPIVALRRSVADLPIQFELTDSDAMVPGTKLSDYDTLVVTAKISRSGLATDVVADLETWSTPVSPLESEEIQLLITAGGSNE